MHASTLLPPVRAAFSRLIDYAGLFPPAALDERSALDEYDATVAGPNEWLVGRFVAPLSRLEALAVLRDAERPLAVTLILDVDRDARRWFDSLAAAVADAGSIRAEGSEIAIQALEVPLPSVQAVRESADAPVAQAAALLERSRLQGLPVYLELPTGIEGERLDSAMSALARSGLYAKVRCGGTVAEAFPSVERVAEFVAAAARHNVAFKATAGLHHPVRHVDPTTGFTMHGFFNLVAAAALAPDIAPADLTAVVAEEDPQAFSFDESALRWRDRRVDIGELGRMRSHAFHAYGSCSVQEPVDDLTALGVMPPAAR
ncbi:MAG TPA: hypothetical protein VGF18_06425 [Candidatus Tumulicola sp.]